MCQSLLNEYSIEVDIFKKFRMVVEYPQLIDYIIYDYSFVDLKIDTEYARQIVSIYYPDMRINLGPEPELRISYIINQIKEHMDGNSKIRM